MCVRRLLCGMILAASYSDSACFGQQGPRQPAVHLNCRRAIQFLRTKTNEWNQDGAYRVGGCTTSTLALRCSKRRKGPALPRNSNNPAPR